jgi:hypothetical protein
MGMKKYNPNPSRPVSRLAVIRTGYLVPLAHHYLVLLKKKQTTEANLTNHASLNSYGSKYKILELTAWGKKKKCE